MDMMITPAVHTESKSRLNPSRVDALMRHAARIATGVASTQAVYDGDRIIGLVRGESGSKRVLARRCTERMWCGFSTEEAMNDAMKNGQYVAVPWHKDTSGWNKVNIWADTFPCQGVPSAGSYGGSVGIARAYDNTTPGGLELKGKTPGAGQTRHFAKATRVDLASSDKAVWLEIVDRTIGYNSQNIGTLATTMTNTVTASRHISAGEDALQIMCTITSALGATTSAISAVNIVDHAGASVALAPGYTMNYYTSGPAGSTTVPAPIAAPHETTNTETMAPFLPMPAGSNGARRIVDFASTVINTGLISIDLVKPIAAIWISTSQLVQILETGRFTYQLPRIYNDACLSILMLSATNAVADMLAEFGFPHG